MRQPPGTAARGGGGRELRSCKSRRERREWRPQQKQKGAGGGSAPTSPFVDVTHLFAEAADAEVPEGAAVGGDERPKVVDAAPPLLQDRPRLFGVLDGDEGVSGGGQEQRVAVLKEGPNL